MAFRSPSPAPSPSSTWRVTALKLLPSGLYCSRSTPSQAKPRQRITFDGSLIVCLQRFDQGSRGGAQIRLRVEAAADQEDHIPAVALDPVASARHADPTAGDRKRGPQSAERAAQTVVDRGAGRLREGEAPAGVRIDDAVRAEDAEQVAKEHVRSDSVVRREEGTGEGGVRQDRQTALIRCPAEGIRTRKHGGEQHAAAAGPPRRLQPRG